MPIATVQLTEDLAADPSEIVRRWSEISGIADEEMTLTVTTAAQGGKRYAAIAWLSLPSLWDDGSIEALGEGLAAALADTLTVPVDSVLVITSIVGSSRVVESGKTRRW